MAETAIFRQTERHGISEIEGLNVFEVESVEHEMVEILTVSKNQRFTLKIAQQRKWNRHRLMGERLGAGTKK